MDLAAACPRGLCERPAAMLPECIMQGERKETDRYERSGDCEEKL